MDFRLLDQAHNVCRDVPPPGCALLVSPERHDRMGDDDTHARRTDVLWRWVRHYAGVCRRLFWHEERWSNLWSDADGVGCGQRCRTAAGSLHARDDRVL